MNKSIVILLFFVAVTIVGAKSPRWMVNEKGKYFLTDSLGEKISDKCYDFGYDFYNYCSVPVRDHFFWGAINTSGKEIAPCIYDYVDCHSYSIHDDTFLQDLSDDSNIIICIKRGKYYAYDKDGTLLLKKCLAICNLLRGNLLYRQGRFGRLKLFSLRDRCIYNVDDKKLKLGSFSHFDENGIAVVVLTFDENTIRQSYLFGAVDASGKYVVPCIYKKEEEVMAKIGRTERSFNYLNNK